jgi:methionyl-tRNA formyltransferase
MDVGLDTGDIIEIEKFPINADDDFEAIHDRSAEVGSKLLSETIVKLGEGTATRTPQNNELATYAAKIEKEDSKIDFALDAATLDCRIRGVTPIPGAFCYLGGKMLKILRATPVAKTGDTPGLVVDVDPVGNGSFTVLCGTGALLVTSVKPEGKGAMSAGDFIRGRKIAKGDILE